MQAVIPRVRAKVLEGEASDLLIYSKDFTACGFTWCGGLVHDCTCNGGFAFAKGSCGHGVVFAWHMFICWSWHMACVTNNQAENKAEDRTRRTVSTYSTPHSPQGHNSPRFAVRTYDASQIH